MEELKSGLYDNILLNKDYKPLGVETYEQLIQTNWLHPPRATRQFSLTGNTAAVTQTSLVCSHSVPLLEITGHSSLYIRNEREGCEPGNCKTLPSDKGEM